MYDIGISEIAVTAKYEDTEDTEDRRHFEKRSLAKVTARLPD